MVDESISLGKEHATQKRVLHNSHDWFVALRIHHLLRDQHDLFDFCNCLVALRNVHVHFIAIEVSIVW